MLLESGFSLLAEIARDDIYFVQPEWLRQKFLVHLKGQLLKNKINKEEFETYKRELLKGLERLKITNVKKEIIKKQVNAALNAAAISEGFEKALRRSIKSKHWLAQLRKILLQRIKLLKLKGKHQAFEEFQLMLLEMQQLQLESEALERERRRREKEGYFGVRIQVPSEIADNLTGTIVGSCEILSEFLGIEEPILQREEQETLNSDLLYLEHTFRSEEPEDLEEIDNRLSGVCNVLEKIHDAARARIEKDLEKNKILDNWCNGIETTLLDWINNEPVKKFDQTMKEKIVRDLKQGIHQEKSEEQTYAKAFTPMKKIQSMLYARFNHEPHDGCDLKSLKPRKMIP